MRRLRKARHTLARSRPVGLTADVVMEGCPPPRSYAFAHPLEAFFHLGPDEVRRMGVEGKQQDAEGAWYDPDNLPNEPPDPHLCVVTLKALRGGSVVMHGVHPSHHAHFLLLR